MRCAQCSGFDNSPKRPYVIFDRALTNTVIVISGRARIHARTCDVYFSISPVFFFLYCVSVNFVLLLTSLPALLLRLGEGLGVERLFSRSIIQLLHSTAWPFIVWHLRTIIRTMWSMVRSLMIVWSNKKKKQIRFDLCFQQFISLTRKKQLNGLFERRMLLGLRLLNSFFGLVRFLDEKALQSSLYDDRCQ